MVPLPAYAPQTGQAPMPWPARTASATVIWSASEARLADAAYWSPPYASQVDWVNCRPP